MSRELTGQFTQLLFDNDLIYSAVEQRSGATTVYGHYPNGSILRLHVAKTNLINLELDVNGKTTVARLNTLEALEYVKTWSLDLETGIFVTSMDEAYSAARDLLKIEGVDASAVDVKKFAAYITYPRVGNYAVHGLLVKLPAAPSHLQYIVRACTYED